jgi:radical SAM superfamily enzyme YgiQ (UPF0313 family)
MSLKILLLQPTNNVQSGDRLVPPLWASVLSAITPSEHQVDFLHCGFETPTEKKLSNYDVVGISVLTTMAKDAYRVGDMCKRANVKCVMGGIHTFIFPTTKLAEIVRGCPHGCRFCGATMYSGKKYRYKMVDNLVAEIQRWESSGRIAHFTNTNLIASPKKTLEIMENIKEFNLRWWSPCSVDILDHENLLKAVADSGCMVLQFGFDSLSPDTLKSMNKSFNIKRDYRKLIKLCHDYGIEVSGSFIFGWDTDTKDVFKTTVDFVLDADIDMPVFFPLTPFPGTDIYETFKSQGRILTNDWSKYNWNTCVYKPKNMTAQELLEGCYYAFEQSYSYGNIIQRLFSRPRGLREIIMLMIISGSGRFVMSFSKPWWAKGKGAMITQ